MTCVYNNESCSVVSVAHLCVSVAAASPAKSDYVVVRRPFQLFFNCCRADLQSHRVENSNRLPAIAGSFRALPAILVSTYTV